MKAWGGERLRWREKPRQSEAPLCLPWGAWARDPVETAPPKTPYYPQASSKQPARGREGTGGPEILAAPWDEPWGESHPLPPLLGYMGGAMPDLLSGQRPLPENCWGWGGVRAGKGEERRGERVYWEVVTISDTQSPREEVPRSLALALPLGSTQLGSELHLLPNSPSKETAGQSCEESGTKGREQEGDPQAAHPQLR